ncbi:Tetratricopeptide-like helical [Penicillium verrucosum]|uniref:Tetratricopeptide-like helical n=1 Tax=Penicillium verrucosum TaxID=60171 RepID=UPI0025459A0D|nr:Tetratricopeptide-like helical [Penicillium verrucosum]KAJ5943339.1 Tetratricopeptide-like helical [Penicillium verrucosum]
MSTSSPFGLKEATKTPDEIRGETRKEHDKSPIWQAAIDRYYEELRKGGVKRPTIDRDVWSIHSPDDLIQQINDFAPANSMVGTLRRLEPILLSLNDFAAVVTLALGMQGQVAALIWGSMRLILKVEKRNPKQTKL